MLAPFVFRFFAMHAHSFIEGHLSALQRRLPFRAVARHGLGLWRQRLLFEALWRLRLQLRLERVRLEVLAAGGGRQRRRHDEESESERREAGHESVQWAAGA